MSSKFKIVIILLVLVTVFDDLSVNCQLSKEFNDCLRMCLTKYANSRHLRSPCIHKCKLNDRKTITNNNNNNTKQINNQNDHAKSTTTTSTPTKGGQSDDKENDIVLNQSNPSKPFVGEAVDNMKKEKDTYELAPARVRTRKRIPNDLLKKMMNKPKEQANNITANNTANNITNNNNTSDKHKSMNKDYFDPGEGKPKQDQSQKPIQESEEQTNKPKKKTNKEPNDGEYQKPNKQDNQEYDQPKNPEQRHKQKPEEQDDTTKKNNHQEHEGKPHKPSKKLARNFKIDDVEQPIEQGQQPNQEPEQQNYYKPKSHHHHPKQETSPKPKHQDNQDNEQPINQDGTQLDNESDGQDDYRPKKKKYQEQDENDYQKPRKQADQEQDEQEQPKPRKVTPKRQYRVNPRTPTHKHTESTTEPNDEEDSQPKPRNAKSHPENHQDKNAQSDQDDNKKSDDNFKTLEQPDHCGFRTTKDFQNSNKNLKSTSGLGRIVGGVDANPHEFPWITSLQYYTEDNTNTAHFCGGSIITKNYILTAAHCMDRFVGKETSVLIKVGVNGVKEKSEQTLKVAKITVHKGWNATTQLDDIALIKFKPDVKFTTTKTGQYRVNALCLPDSQNEPTGDAVIAGWGEFFFKAGVPAEYLQKVPVPFVPRSTCKEEYKEYLENMTPKSYVKVKTNHICAGGKGGEDACRGDSGGPLVQPKGRQYFQYGLVSFSAPCALKDLPTIYTNIIHYMNWITSHVNS